MAKLIKAHRKLERAENRLQKLNKPKRELKLRMERTELTQGKFKTRSRLVFEEKSHRFSNRGVIHKIANLDSRIVGDRPSVTRSIHSMTPQTFGGKVLKGSAVFANWTAHKGVHLGRNALLGTETATLKVADTAKRTLKRKLVGKYKSDADDDVHKATLFVGGLAKDSFLGAKKHRRLTKQYKIEKTKLTRIRAKQVIHEKETFPTEFAKAQAELAFVRRKFEERVDLNKATGAKDSISKRMYQNRRKEFQFQEKQAKTKIKSLKKQESQGKKLVRKQARVADLTRPTPLALQPTLYASKRMTASAWQKAANADEDNDFLRATDSIKRHGVDKVSSQMKADNLQSTKAKKRSKLEDKKAKSQTKLKVREDRLKSKQDLVRKRKKPRKPMEKSTSQKVGAVLSNVVNVAKNIYTAEARRVVLSYLLPVFVVFMIFAFLLMIFSSAFKSSTFVLGTYAAQDYDLTQAEIVYTSFAYELNKKVLACGEESTWQATLVSFGATKSDLTDTPDTYVFGQSKYFNWTAEYDFDVYKLWSFLCAYYYDFDSDDDDIQYWKFTASTGALLLAMFNMEYEFVYKYDNSSHWETLDEYVYFGGGLAATGEYYRAVSTAHKYTGRDYTYRFKPITITSELAQYLDDEGYLCLAANYRVLDPNNGYAYTGYMVRDHRYTVNGSDPFYYYESSTDSFFFTLGSNKYYRSFWGWDGDDAWFLVSPTDTEIWNYTLVDECLYAYYQKYYWKTDCTLYYNIKQNMTFDEVIAYYLKNASHSSERIEYYNLLVGNEGTNYDGNHQTLLNPLKGDTIKSYSLKQAYGYGLITWNQACAEYFEGLKVSYTKGSAIYACFDCKIVDVDTKNNTITIRANDVEYWYDGSGGTERDTKVILSNVTLADGYEKGNTISAGAVFAKATDTWVGVQVYLDTDGVGWHFIDPRLVIY